MLKSLKALNKSALILLLFIVPGSTLFAQDDDVANIGRLLDNWHRAAAEANDDVFFGSMTEECIYIGTDISEKWKRDELREWSAKYFDRESAWSFTPREREIYLDNDIAWFDEKLDTWMGECRGSGVLKKTKEGWKLKHYHLSVTVPNEKIQDFIELVEKAD